MNIRMKITMISCIAAGVLTVLVPLLSDATNRGRGHAPLPPEVILLPDTNDADTGDISDSPATPQETADPVTDDREPEPPEIFTVRVLDADTGKITEMELDDYITCVVAAEMPYTFNSEALKAQAVAARSFCLYRMKNGTGHDGADICTSYAHCAAFITKDGLTEKYGKVTAEKIEKKIGEAVKATSGRIITYGGQPALALFHSRSYGYTESSENVWDGRVPYLVSVTTPEDDSVTEVTVSDSQLKAAFSSDYAVKVSAGGGKAVLTSEKNSSGRQSSMFYGNHELTARRLRTLLGLRSCCFEYQRVDGGWKFTVHGYGHGVGMSQYGANEMAKRGFGYEEILLHYYTGVAVTDISSMPER